MRFNSMKAFNLEVLGKQAWKFISNPNLLMNRLLKAKDFTLNDYVSVGLGHNPSYVWCELWSVKDVLRCEFKWSICSK
jgi:hypothetical protein